LGGHFERSLGGSLGATVIYIGGVKSAIKLLDARGGGAYFCAQELRGGSFSGASGDGGGVTFLCGRFSKFLRPPYN